MLLCCRFLQHSHVTALLDPDIMIVVVSAAFALAAALSLPMLALALTLVATARSLGCHHPAGGPDGALHCIVPKH